MTGNNAGPVGEAPIVGEHTSTRLIRNAPLDTARAPVLARNPPTLISLAPSPADRAPAPLISSFKDSPSSYSSPFASQADRVSYGLA